MPTKEKRSRMTEDQKEKERQRSRRYHAKNKAKVAERKRKKREERYAMLLDIHNNECALCGVSSMPNGFFDFHHTDPTKKEGSVSAMLSSANFDRVIEECKKCLMLCPNCHRLEHLKYGHYYSARSMACQG